MAIDQWSTPARVLLLGCLLSAVRPSLGACAAAIPSKESVTDQIRLPEGIGWDAWQAVREQHNDRATVKVFVPKGQAPATAKVRLVLAQRPKPTFDSPQAILDSILQTAKRQCQKISAKPLHKTTGELIFELRGFGCTGQTGERYLLQRIAFLGDWELEATYAPMISTDDLPASEKNHALRLLSSVTITPSPSAAVSSGWFLVTPPQMPDGHFDKGAPLSKWKIEEGAGSRDKCERLRSILSTLASERGGPADIEQVRDARCVSSEDPDL